MSESSTSSVKTFDEISSGNTEQKKNQNISTKRKEIKGMDKNTVIKEKEGNSKCDNQTIKAVLRVEKTEVFKTGWNFACCSCFASYTMKKHHLLSCRNKKKKVFPYFHHEIIFYCVELFKWIFKFYENIFMFLNINTNHTSKEHDLNSTRSNHLFLEQLQIDALGVKCQACSFNLRGCF